MTHSRKTAFSLNLQDIGQDGPFFLQAGQRLWKLKEFSKLVRTIFISLEEGYLNLIESKVTCDVIKDSGIFTEGIP